MLWYSGGDPSHWESVQTEAISFKRKKKDKKSSSGYVGKRDAGAIAAKRMRDKEQQKYVSFLPANEEKKFGPTGDPIKKPGFIDKALKKLKDQTPVKKVTEAKELKKAKINYKTTKKGGKTTYHVNKNDESDAQKAMKNDPKYILGKTRVQAKEGYSANPAQQAAIAIAKREKKEGQGTGTKHCKYQEVQRTRDQKNGYSCTEICQS